MDRRRQASTSGCPCWQSRSWGGCTGGRRYRQCQTVLRGSTCKKVKEKGSGRNYHSQCDRRPRSWGQVDENWFFYPIGGVGKNNFCVDDDGWTCNSRSHACLPLGSDSSPLVVWAAPLARVSRHFRVIVIVIVVIIVIVIIRWGLVAWGRSLNFDTYCGNVNDNDVIGVISVGTGDGHCINSLAHVVNPVPRPVADLQI